jgi:hypothetical protein
MLPMMKIIYICLLALTLLVLIFFTVYGETAYEWGKPRVILTSASTYLGNDDAFVPLEAVRSDSAGDHIFILQSEQGYSRVIFTVARIDIEVVEIDEFQKTATIASHSGVRAGDRVVTSTTAPLSNEQRVLINR